MNLLIHNLRIAFRNLLKYKFQNSISALSIAIGIVTLAAVHSIMVRFQLPAICSEPYYERTYFVSLDSINKTKEYNSQDLGVKYKYEYIKALRADDGLQTVDGDIVVPNCNINGALVHFHLGQSFERKIAMVMMPIDASYAQHEGIHSAITGMKIKSLKKGEAIISDLMAHEIFGNQSPIGATTEYNTNGIDIPLTIVDVFKDVSKVEPIIGNEWLIFGVGDHMEDLFENCFFSQWIEVVLKEDCTPTQLEKEINARLKPYGIHCKNIQRAPERPDLDVVGIITTSQFFVHLIGSLILFAAVIGFLRMQTQLFWMRRREISLRFANGANRWQIFMMLMTEVSIVIAFSAVMSVLLGIWLNYFFTTHLSVFIHEAQLSFTNLYIYGIIVSIALFVICAAIVWIVLHRICKAEQGLVQSMHSSRSHLLRNVMLGLQIFISMFFVCGTLELVQATSSIIDMKNVPGNDDDYKQTVLLKASEAEDGHHLIEKVNRLADVKQTIPFSELFYSFKEVLDNPDVIKKLEHKTYFYSYVVADTAIFNLYGIETKWFPDNTDRRRCIVLSDQLYQKLDEVGLTGSRMLTLNDSALEGPLPIAGTYKNIPYIDHTSNMANSFFVIAPELTHTLRCAIVIPHNGKYTKAMHEVNATVARLEPVIVTQMVYNLRDYNAGEVVVLEAIQTGAWVLGIIIIIICAMNVYSSIALDTRSRRKEVAIRKIYGAEQKDIIMLFGRQYVIFIVLGIIIATPCNLLLHKLLIMNFPFQSAFSPAIAICIGIPVIILLIVLIVGWHIKKVMRVECDEIIAKE